MSALCTCQPDICIIIRYLYYIHPLRRHPPELWFAKECAAEAGAAAVKEEDPDAIDVDPGPPPSSEAVAAASASSEPVHAAQNISKDDQDDDEEDDMAAMVRYMVLSGSPIARILIGLAAAAEGDLLL